MTDDSEPAAGSGPAHGPKPTDGPRSNDGSTPADGPKPADGSLPTGGADHWVYVLRCADGTLYTGYTTDVERRVSEHDAGDGAKYTRGRTPVEVVHAEGFDSRSAALSREHEVKALSRSEKERLVEGLGDG